MTPPGTRRLAGAFITMIALCGLAGAISIPFYFESSSILYKFGLDRWILRAAQVSGVVAGYLLICQIILGARLRILDRLFGLNNLFRYHRINGIAIFGLVLIHPILIFISDDRLYIPFQMRYWPEFVGLFLSILIVIMVISANWRTRLNLPFHYWWPMHRAAGVFAATCFLLHLLYASETFSQKIPSFIGWSAVVFCGLVFIWIWTRHLRLRQHHYRVSSVQTAARDALSLEINFADDNAPPYSPGQFCFISFRSKHISEEEHPFTIASSPTQTDKMEFIIRTTGDWTGRLYKLHPGDHLRLDGPYGHFTHLSMPEAPEIIMIAGGIGITPMLSMLRYMADVGDSRRITLIWSNRTAGHVMAKEEIDLLGSRLKHFSIHHVITRSSEAEMPNRRIDRSALEQYLSDCDTRAAIVMCGPDQMMADLIRHLLSLGFQKSRIETERFRF